MNTADKSTLATFGKIVIAALIVIAGLFAFHKCAEAQTAGTINMAFDYSAGVDKAMIQQHGTDWISSFAKPQLREAWKNQKSTASEAYKAAAAEVFDESIDPELLLKSETNMLQRIADSVAARKARKAQVEADSVAAAQQTRGSLIIEKDGYRAVVSDPELVSMNRLQPIAVGKAYSPRLDFLGGLIAPTPSEAPAPAPPSGLPFSEDAFITYVYVVHILAVVGVIALGYWLYTAAVR
jgi:hypothetical protein